MEEDKSIKDQTLKETLIIQNEGLDTKLLIRNNCNEGAYQLKVIELLTKSKLKTFLSIVIILITFGLYGVILVWYPSLRKLSFYKIINLKSQKYNNNLLLIKKGLTHVFIDINLQILQRSKIHKNQNKISSIKSMFLNTNQVIEKVSFISENPEFKFLNLKYEIFVKNDILILNPLITEEQQLSLEKLKKKSYFQNEMDISQKQKKYGKCMLETKKPNFFKFIGTELISIPFITQYLVAAIWIVRGLYILAIIMVGFSITFLFLNFFIFILPSFQKLKKKIQINNNIQVERVINNKKETITINSQDLVPGDIFNIEADLKLPCDALLIQGNLYMNEAALTGESIPIPKFSIQEAQKTHEILDFEKHKRHLLFEGTNVTSTPLQNSQGLVLRTGYMTTKGQLLRSVIFPQNDNQNLYISLLKFISFAAIIIILSFPFYAKVLLDGGISDGTIAFLLLGSIVEMVPPALPILISANISGSISRLSKFKILAQEPQKILKGQGIQTMCFDKTGTITTDEIILKEVLDENFEVYEDFNNPKKVQQFNWFLGSCHTVQNSQQEKEGKVENNLQGDNLEIQMIEFSKSIVNQDGSITTADNKNIKVLKVYEFDSNVARMTVLVEVKCPNQSLETEYYIFTKGAPEIMVSQCCDKSLIPKDYENKLHQMSFQGYRTLAIAKKQISYEECQRIIKDSPNREEIEFNLQFKGLFGFINPLKPDAADVIGNLTQGLYNCVIISGDNPLTTIACGLKVNLFNNNVKREIQKLILLNIDENQIFKPEIIDVEQLKNIDKVYTKKFVDNFNDLQNYEYFVTTGKLFRAFTNKKLDLNQDQYEILHNLLVQKTKIFARQKPDQKAQIIELFQKSGIKCGMIGDGSNDCAAIKQADLGISYQFCDASFASPFQYQKNDLQVVPILIQDAKCCMANIIDGFRLNNYSSIIKFFCYLVCAFEVTQLPISQMQWVMLFTQGPCFIFIARCKPLDYKKNIKRIFSIDDFFNYDHIFNFLQIGFFSFSCFLCGYFYLNSQDWHIKLNKDDKQNNETFIMTPNQLQTTMAIMITFVNALCYVFLIHGEPLKKAFHKQYFLFYYLVTYLTLQIILVLFLPQQWQESLQGFVPLNFRFLFNISCMSILFSFCIFLTNRVISYKFGIKSKIREFNKNCKYNEKEYFEKKKVKQIQLTIEQDINASNQSINIS